MTDSAGTISTFFDIHQHDQVQLTVEDYLSVDLLRNWNAAWKNDLVNEKKFFEHSGSIQARKQLWYNGWVTICGYPGDGKSCIAKHLASYFQQKPSKFPDVNQVMSTGKSAEFVTKEFIKLAIDDEERDCYAPVYINSPQEYREKVDPNVHQIVIIDDVFGEAVMQQRKIENWRLHLEEILWDVTTRKPNTLVVMCVNKAHLDRAPSDVTQLEWFKQANMIDLHTTHTLTEDDILKMTRFSRQEMEIHRRSGKLESAALLYKMRNLVAKFKMDGEVFFQNPWDNVLAEIDQIYRVDRIVYYTLAVCVMLDGTLDLGKQMVSEYDGRTRQVMEQLISLLDVPFEVNQSKMRFAAKLLTGFFFRRISEWKWEMTHPRVFSLCLQSLLKLAAKGTIELLSTDVICKYIRTDHTSNTLNSELVIPLERQNYETLAQRLMLGILSGHMSLLVQNECFQNEELVETFFNIVKETGNLGQVIFQKDRSYGRSFFYWACHYGHGYLVKLLLLENDEINIKKDARFDKEFSWGFLAACACPSEESYLVLKNLHEIAGDHIRVGKIDEENSKVIRMIGNDLSYLLSMEASLLHIACLKGHHKTAEYLIGVGEDIEKKALDGTRVIHCAASRKDKEGSKVVHTLLVHAVNMETKTARHFTALDEAVESGSVDSVRLLVAAFANFSKCQGEEGSSYLAKAIQRREIDLVRFILSKNPILNGVQGSDMFPPLSLAIQTGDISIVEELLNKSGADIDCKGSNGLTPLHVACYLSNITIIDKLINGGANVNAVNHELNTPLHIAAEKGQFNICELLLNKGAKTELMNTRKETPVVCAARGDHAMVTWLLLREGMDL